MMFVSIGIGVAIAVALIVVVSIFTGGTVKNGAPPPPALVGTTLSKWTQGGLSGGTVVAPWTRGTRPWW